jgi:hypothetical protein
MSTTGIDEWYVGFSPSMKPPTTPVIDELGRLEREIRKGNAIVESFKQTVMVGNSFDIDFHIIEFIKQGVMTPAQLGQKLGVSQAGGYSRAQHSPFTHVVTIADIPRNRVADGGVVIEPYVGYRDFEVLTKDDVHEPSLVSRNGLLWEYFKPMIAMCHGNVFAKHDAPHIDCECGIYAFDKPTHRDLKSTAMIWGEVNLWGTVLVCPEGYRAQYAYPKTLFVRDVGTNLIRVFAENLEKAYGVPVHLVQEREGMTAGELMEAELKKLLGEGE